jgi:hypothetical protein
MVVSYTLWVTKARFFLLSEEKQGRGCDQKTVTPCLRWLGPQDRLEILSWPWEPWLPERPGRGVAWSAHLCSALCELCLGCETWCVHVELVRWTQGSSAQESRGMELESGNERSGISRPHLSICIAVYCQGRAKRDRLRSLPCGGCCFPHNPCSKSLLPVLARGKAHKQVTMRSVVIGPVWERLGKISKEILEKLSFDLIKPKSKASS